jgi:hypothetical protein
VSASGGVADDFLSPEKSNRRSGGTGGEAGLFKFLMEVGSLACVACGERICQFG